MIIFRLIFTTILLFSLTTNVYAALGKAAVYKVTMKKVALCTGKGSGTTCLGEVVVGTGSKEVDVAAVDAGAVAGSFGNPALLPLGVTYTHMQVTIDRKFTVKTSDTAGEMLKTDDGDVCRTVANADAQYATDEATDKYTHKRAVDEGTGSASAETRVYLMNHGTNNVTTCAATDCSSTGTTTSGSTCTYCAAMKSDLDSDDTEHVLIYSLTKPYTVTTKSPKVTMKFGTAEALSANVDPKDLHAVAEIADKTDISFEGQQVFVNGNDLTVMIRSAEVNAVVSYVAANPEVRAVLRRAQRSWARQRGGGVLEGRDIGSVVFPRAKLKVYVTATPEERAQRRSLESGRSIEEILAEIQGRDEIDSSRADSPLAVSENAIIVDTTGKSLNEVAEEVLRSFNG